VTGERRRLSSLLVSGVIVLAAFAGVALLPSVGAQGTGPVNGGRTAATFNQSNITEERGDIAAIGLNLSGATNATVTVGSTAVNYETNVTVNDTNGDGRVTLLMNTFIAGTGDNETNVYETAADADGVVRTNRTTEQLNAPLDTSTYNLSVAVGGRRTDTAALELTERTTGELVTWTAPATSFDNVTNTSEVAAAVENGRITTTDTIATGDVLVNQFKLSGVYGALAASNFTQLVERGALDYSLVQTNPDTNRRPKRLNLNRSLANDSIRVIPDERNDVLYINVNTTRAVFENGAPAAGDEFKSTLTLNGESNLAESDQSISANVTFVGAELSLSEVTLTADANQTVTGTTSVAPGSEVTVRLQNNDTGSFVKTNTTMVKPNGTFVATFNLSDIPPRTAVNVRADGPLNTSDRANVTIQPSRSNESVNGTASLTFTDQRTTGETVTVQNVTLPSGGFVVVHAPNVSTAPVESVLGASSYLNSTNGSVEITLDEPLNRSTRLVVMAHRDTNDNQVYDFGSSNGSEDGPYTAGGNPVTASARVTIRDTTQRMTLTETEMTTRVNNVVNGATSTTSENGPGFGIGVVALALVLAGLAAWRSR
jgi:hypothetical protein